MTYHLLVWICGYLLRHFIWLTRVFFAGINQCGTENIAEFVGTQIFIFSALKHRAHFISFRSGFISSACRRLFPYQVDGFFIISVSNIVLRILSCALCNEMCAARHDQCSELYVSGNRDCCLFTYFLCY